MLWTGSTAVDSTASTATPLGADVQLLDTRMGGYDGITAAYLIRS